MSLSRISHAKIVGFSLLYCSILDTTAGVATFGLLPPMRPGGLRVPVTKILQLLCDDDVVRCAGFIMHGCHSLQRPMELKTPMNGEARLIAVDLYIRPLPCLVGSCVAISAETDFVRLRFNCSPLKNDMHLLGKKKRGISMAEAPLKQFQRQCTY